MSINYLYTHTLYIEVNIYLNEINAVLKFVFKIEKQKHG